MDGLFLFFGLVGVMYSVIVGWLYFKIENLKRLEFRVLPFLEDENPIPYYAIGYKSGRSWIEATELFRGYNPIWNAKQREIISMRFEEEIDALPFLREFKGSLRDISLLEIVKKGRKKPSKRKSISDEEK